MPPSQYSYKPSILLIKAIKEATFCGHYVTFFVNYFELFHSFSGGLRGELKVRGISQWNNGMVEQWNNGLMH
jgi:hypothetical protein